MTLEVLNATLPTKFYSKPFNKTGKQCQTRTFWKDDGLALHILNEAHSNPGHSVTRLAYMTQEVVRFSFSTYLKTKTRLHDD